MENTCKSCGNDFDEPVLLENDCAECNEDYVCPHCGSMDWDTNNDE